MNDPNTNLDTLWLDLRNWAKRLVEEIDHVQPHVQRTLESQAPLTEGSPSRESMALVELGLLDWPIQEIQRLYRRLAEQIRLDAARQREVIPPPESQKLKTRRRSKNKE